MSEKIVKVAKTAGFCFGVKRAVEKVYEQVNMGKPEVYTFGPIIHNEEVVNDLSSKGVKVLDNKEELEQLESGTVVIRSHGVSKDIYQLIEEKKLDCVDATCPFVRKIHKIVERESKNGCHIVIIGNASHPEVEGIKGWCEGPVTVISSKKEAEAFSVTAERICIVSQTTFNYNKFQELVEIFSKKSYDRVVLNTICSATEERQLEARQIACESDTMIVIGGKNSSNTQKLYEICKNECKNTYYVQTVKDLESDESFQCDGCVGITAGASTPNNIIEEVQKHVRIKF